MLHFLKALDLIKCAFKRYWIPVHAFLQLTMCCLTNWWLFMCWCAVLVCAVLVYRNVDGSVCVFILFVATCQIWWSNLVHEDWADKTGRKSTQTCSKTSFTTFRHCLNEVSRGCITFNPAKSWQFHVMSWKNMNSVWFQTLGLTWVENLKFERECVNRTVSNKSWQVFGSTTGSTWAQPQFDRSQTSVDLCFVVMNRSFSYFFLQNHTVSN
jgi:hypothetical protein